MLCLYNAPAGGSPVQYYTLHFSALSPSPGVHKWSKLDYDDDDDDDDDAYNSLESHRKTSFWNI